MSEPLAKYLHDAKVAELIDSYQKRGFRVQPEHREGPFVFDIAAFSESGQRVYVEVKTDRVDGDQAARMARYVSRLHNARFELVVAVPPKPKHIEVDGLEEALAQYLIAQETPHELDALSSHTRITGIADLDIDSIDISEDQIEISGTATVEVTLQYGADVDQEDDEGEYLDSFSADFSATLDMELNIVEAEFDIDTSSFDEPYDS